jgi:hypothetical protein
VVIVGVGYGVIILMVLWVVKGLPTPPYRDWWQ